MIIKYYEPIDGVWYDITGNTGDTLTLGADGWNTSAGGGTASWGSISGTITDQKDLTDYLQTNYITSSGYIDAVKIGTGVVNNTEFNYLDGVSGAIQTQLNGKLNKNTAITGDTKTKITYDSNGLVTAGTDITASDIPSGISASKISSGLVDNTEFDYLNNVSGNIQTQLNTKVVGNSAITGATNLKITYDSKGLVTAGTTASTSDLSDVGAWTDCSSNSISGWSATTTKLMQYKLIGGKTMIFQFEIVGTGSGGASSITLPQTSSSWGNQYFIYHALNGTTNASALASVGTSTTTLNVYPSFISGGAWSSGAVRNIRGTLIINIA